MQTVSRIEALNAVLMPYRKQDECVVFVPTMGDLHAGHLSLISAAKAISSKRKPPKIIASIFVNPLQFGPNEDFSRYPRQLLADQTKLSEAGVDVLFTPEISTLYPQGKEQCSRILVPELSEQLCGASRSGHFSGVATVVCKLFNLMRPNHAFFGEKDYQQLLVIEKMVNDLNMPVEVHGVPTVREADGLAMSSRNRYLTVAERQQAPELCRTLQWLVKKVEGGMTCADAENAATEALSQQGFVCDYISIRRASDLALPTKHDRILRVLAATMLGKTRLIDNLALIRQN